MKISNSLIVSFIDETTMEAPLIVWKLHNHVEICLKNGSRVENIFSKKNANPIESGDSIETAFYFKNARTSQEALSLMYKYLNNKGYDPTELQRTQVINKESSQLIKQGFLIDEWILPDGKKVYFKTKQFVGL
jgi:hypothetical protein